MRNDQAIMSRVEMRNGGMNMQKVEDETPKPISKFSEKNMIKVLPQFIFEDNLVPYDVIDKKSSVK